MRAAHSATWSCYCMVGFSHACVVLSDLSTALTNWSCMILTSSVEASCFSLCLSASIYDSHQPSPFERCIGMFNLLFWAQWVKNLAVLRIAQHTHTELHNFCEVGESQILSVLRIARHFHLCNLCEVSECSETECALPCLLRSDLVGRPRLRRRQLLLRRH